MARQGFTPIMIAIAIVLATVLIGGGYIAYRKYIPRIQPQQQISPSDYSLPAPRFLAPRVTPGKPTSTTLREGFYRNRLTVKFKEGTKVRLREKQFVTLGSDDLTQLQQILAAHRVLEISRVFTAPEGQIDKEKQEIEKATGQQVGDLNLYYQITVAEGDDLAGLIDELNSLTIVERAELVALPAPPPTI